MIQENATTGEYEQISNLIHSIHGKHPCLVCLVEDERLRTFKNVASHLVQKHEMTAEEYEEQYCEVPSFEPEYEKIDLKPLSEIEIDDSLDSVTCRLCGSQERMIHPHLKKHDVDYETYTAVYPDAPTRATKGQLLEFAWDFIEDQTRMANTEMLWDLEHSWVLEDEMDYQLLKQLYDATGSTQILGVNLGACLWYVKQAQHASVTPEEIAEVVDAPRKKIWTKITSMDVDIDVRSPKEKIDSRLDDFDWWFDEQGIARAEVESVIYDQIDEHLRYSHSPRILVGVAVSVVDDDLTQKEIARTVEKTDVGLRRAAKRLGLYEQTGR